MVSLNQLCDVWNALSDVECGDLKWIHFYDAVKSVTLIGMSDSSIAQVQVAYIWHELSEIDVGDLEFQDLLKAFEGCIGEAVN